MLTAEYLDNEFPPDSSLDDLINGLELEDVPCIDDSIQVLENELNNLTWPQSLGKGDLEELDLELQEEYSKDLKNDENVKEIHDNKYNNDSLQRLKEEMNQELYLKDFEINRISGLVKNLELEISRLQKENSSLKEETVSITTIKESLKEEKELEMLEFKKETLILKEKQLKEFVSEWNLQKEDLSKKYSMDLSRIQRDFEKEILELTRQMDKLESEKDLLQQKLYDQDRKSRKVDFECQTGDLIPNLQDEILQIFNFKQGSNGSVLDSCKYAAGKIDTLTNQLKEKDLELNGLKQDFQKLNQKLQENQGKYEEETRLLKKVHSAEMTTVKALSESVKKEWDYVNLDKVLTDFPNIQSEFKTIVFQKVEKALAEQRCKNSEYVDQLLIGHQNQISELLKSFEAEKETWRKERNAEILALSTKLKNTCSDAYSSSISRVQSHIESEKKSLLQEFEMDKQLLKVLY